MSRQRYEVGQVIQDDYRVLAVYHGFLGLVYICSREAESGEGREYAAIKTFRHGDRLSRALFDAEIANWFQLPAHPNIVQARDADTEEKLLILEFVPGPSLRKIAYRKPIHPRHFVCWANDIAAGLRFLHVENSFLHRDLRPANVLVDTKQDLRAKISDLGIGKPFDPEVAQHTVIGTFNYMAPEVFQRRTDYRSDIFSFGATLYNLLTGEEAVKLTTQNMNRIVSPGEQIPGLPEPVSAWLLRCVERQPEDRYHSMDEVIAAFPDISGWQPPSGWYEHCDQHDYHYYVDGSESRCAFCVYEEDFDRKEQELLKLQEKETA